MTNCKHQEALTNEDLRTYGEPIGVSGGDVAKAIERRKYGERINGDVRSGETSDVRGTPALFVNGSAFDSPSLGPKPERNDRSRPRLAFLGKVKPGKRCRGMR